MTEPRQTISLAYRSDVAEVTMSHWGVGRLNSRTKYLRTTPVAPCIAVVLYDKEHRIGGIAHCPPGDDISVGVERLVQRICTDGGTQPYRLKAHIVGGRDRGSGSPGPMMVADVEKVLDRHRIEIVSKDVFGHDVRAIALDLENGELVNYVHDEATLRAVFRNVDVEMIPLQRKGSWYLQELGDTQQPDGQDGKKSR